MDSKPISRRELLARLAAAGALAPLMSLERGVRSAGGAPLPFSGLAAEYDRHDGLGLAELIAKKQISPLELLQSVRARVERLNPKVNAFCQLFFEKAEVQIKQGLPQGPFRGVPFALKDLGQHLAGTYTPDFDSTLVARYKNAGLVIFGKTTTPEVGLKKTGDRLRFSQFQIMHRRIGRRAYAVSLANHSSEIGDRRAPHQFSGNAGSGPDPFGVSITRTIFRSGTETTTILSWS